MKVIFYTAPSYLDISLEIINILKKRVELHVLIEITPGSKQNNIVDIKKLPEVSGLVRPEELLDDDALKNLGSYFEGTAAVYFVVFRSKSIFSLLESALRVWQYVRSNRPDVFHLEAMMPRSMAILPAMILCRKIFVSVHDPVPHSGEGTTSQKIVNALFFNLPATRGGLFFYSQFALNLFTEAKKIKIPTYVIRMAAYSYFSKVFGKGAGNNDGLKNYILFFGRLSSYKGIDTLLEAMPAVTRQYPTLKLIIAGRPYKGYKLNEGLLKINGDSVIVQDSYIDNNTLVDLIANAKFIVCPYKDATQSGVVMTAFALQKAVVASKVGAFPEYISDNMNGWLVPPDNHTDLSIAILQALENNSYLTCSTNVSRWNVDNTWENNIETYMNAYNS